MKTSETSRNEAALKALRVIPGVGRECARDLYDLGFRSPADLKGKDPEILYRNLCALQGSHVDRCMLYVFRCAVYFAENHAPDPELLKWYNWKDRQAASCEERTEK